MNAIIMIIIMLGLLLFGNIPIAFAFGVASTLYIVFNGIPIAMVIQRAFYGIHNFTLLAIPLFILAANIMNVSGVTERIFNFATTIVGPLKGALAHANVVASMIFSGMSGSALADAGGLGTVEIAAMLRGGYDKKFSVAITGASSTIGPIIPPSIPFVVYGALAEVSVGALFIAGIIPGIIMGISLMVYVYWATRKMTLPKITPPTLSVLLRTTLRALPVLFTPAIIIGGLLTGIFTPTEAAAVTVVYSVVLGLIYGEFTIKKLSTAFLETFKVTSSILFILASAAVFAWALAHSGICAKVGKFFVTISGNPAVFLFLMNIIFLFLGMILDTLSIQIITLPILIPVLNSLGIDPVHFGVIMTLNLMIGVYTPPVGTGLFILREVSGLTFEEVTISVLPMLIPLVVVLFLLTYIPELCLLLPREFGLVR